MDSVAHEMDAAGRDLRRWLADENFLAIARGSTAATVPLRTQEQLDAGMQEILRGHDARSDLHVFGYGSLMWNPALEHAGQSRGKVHGWHRSFCIRSVVGRGTPESPGLMLALDRGGSCNGMLLRIPAAKVRSELALLWRREMTWGAYDARWVTASDGAARIRAVTFVVNRHHERYVTDLQVHDVVRLICTGKGGRGTCRSYFDTTLHKLRELGIRDDRMEQLHDAIVAAQLAGSRTAGSRSQ